MSHIAMYNINTVLDESSHFIHLLVSNLCEISISVLEFLSIGIILFTTFYSLIQLFKEGGTYARVYLLHGQSVGLTFKLGAEILKTVIASNMDEIWQIVMLVIIKAMMILLIDWELNGNHEHKSAEEEDAEKRAVQQADGPLLNGFAKMVKGKVNNYRGLHSHAAVESQIRQYQKDISDLQQQIEELKERDKEISSSES